MNNDSHCNTLHNVFEWTIKFGTLLSLYVRKTFNLVGYLNTFFRDCSVGGKKEVSSWFFLYINLAS